MINIRPVSDLRNRFPEIEELVRESGEPVYLTKNGYGSMVLMSIEQYTVLTDSVEHKLDEADRAAQRDDRRFAGEKVFENVRNRLKEKRYMNKEQWLEKLSKWCEGTEYICKHNGAKGSNSGVIIVPKLTGTPQRIAIYPRVKKGASVAMEMDILQWAQNLGGFSKTYRTTTSNRAQFTDIEDCDIKNLCRRFLHIEEEIE